MMRPQFYDKFLCTGDKCTDNCCIGWEIDIDKPAMERFAKIPGEFGERLRSAIHGGEQPTFALASGDRCALLREDGLCELILTAGTGYSAISARSTRGSSTNSGRSGKQDLACAARRSAG